MTDGITGGLSVPWLSIWTDPRTTIRRIVETDPTANVMLLPALNGGIAALGLMWSRTLAGPATGGALWPLAVAAMAVIGAAASIAMLYFSAWLYRWVGGYLGGKATSVELRAALAWALVPNITAGVIAIVFILMGVASPLSSSGLSLPVSGESALAGLLQWSLGIWGFVIMLMCIGEVHGFSAWRALGTILLPILAIVLAALALTVLVFLIVGFSGGY